MTFLRHNTTRRRVMVALLCLLAMGNASRGMVVCVGAHGHLAIEPAGHDHQAEAAAHAEEAPASLQVCNGLDADHGPCDDIPLLVGPLADRLDTGAKSDLLSSMSAPEKPSLASHCDATLQPFTHSHLWSHCLPLTGVVLQV